VTGAWSFEPDGSGFGPTQPIEISNLGGGVTRQAIRWSGTGIPALPVPAVPALGVAGLGGLLVWFAFRRLRRRSRDPLDPLR
jgi:hypothetical protein